MGATEFSEKQEFLMETCTEVTIRKHSSHKKVDSIEQSSEVDTLEDGRSICSQKRQTLPHYAKKDIYPSR